GMGTTITAAYVDSEDLAIAHVGDSRAYLFRDGALKRLTRDHTLVGALVEQGKLTEEEAAEHPQRSIITRALGPEADVEVDTWSYPLRAGDVVLLCSDGLTSMISEERVAEIVGADAALQSAARALIDEANAAGGRDNITVVLFRLEEVGVDGALEERTAVRPPSERVTRSRETEAPVAPPPSPPPSARQARLARTQGRPGSSPAGRSVPHRRWVAAVISAVIVLALLLGGGFLASRQL